MKSYLLKLAGREEGPYSESQIAQMFADQRINRSTPCKPETGGDWKTIDDYLPMQPSPLLRNSTGLTSRVATFEHLRQNPADRLSFPNVV